MPSTLTVTVEEWQPRYLVSLDRLYYMTAEGHVVRAPLEGGLDYPVVTGLTWADLEGKGPIREALFELFRELDRHFAPGEMSEVHADPTDGFTIYSAANPSQGIQLGFGRMEEKFSRLARLRRHLERNHQVARAVSLTHEDKIIARLVPGEERDRGHEGNR
jgi:cell division septal protein FtsQ